MKYLLLGTIWGCGLALCQAPGGEPGTSNWTTADDHRNMMAQLGITALRPGPSGNEKAPNHANYDERLANPFPDYPELMTLKDGTAVTSADLWRRRRAEIQEDFEREVLGRVPQNAPAITWTVTQRVEDRLGPYPVVAKEITGRADNAGFPGISVEIQLVVVTPAWVGKPVPVMMMFGRAAMPNAPVPAQFARFAPPVGSDVPGQMQLIGAGWGYAVLTPASVQADNGAGLTKGIIGLANRGRPRRPEDWGALRAWAWGASRALDYLETDRDADGKRVGIEGVSRYGKAALVTMAFDERFAVVLVGSSGEGGAKPHRRNFGEAVENLTAAGEYHWMAGNFLKYGASESVNGPKNAGDIPVDSHQLIALCAPRPALVSYGIPEKGDARWLDQQGSFMATVAAGPAYRLLGAKDLGVREDYRTAVMPAVNTARMDGQLAWRQHDGGHTDLPNWKYFIPWAGKMLGVETQPPPPFQADVAVPRLDANSMIAHTRLVEKRKQGRIDVYFEGDSITRRWGALDYPHLLSNWKKNFHGWNAANFGWGADRLQNILWRLKQGELDDVNPKIVVVQGGTNNIGRAIPEGGEEALVEDVTRGLRAVVATVRQKVPEAVVIVTAIFPRNDGAVPANALAAMPVIGRINARLEELAEPGKVRILNINSKLADGSGRLYEGMTDPDKLHLSEKGYQIWADALRPVFREILGEPREEDLGPPPSGDPGVAR
ncbi:MAG: hypothetical protein FJW40_05690 [Acidobacteria bacterium]|nr:hypothetical protein [Acidobacteriota bacterium]